MTTSGPTAGDPSKPHSARLALIALLLAALAAMGLNVAPGFAPTAWAQATPSTRPTTQADLTEFLSNLDTATTNINDILSKLSKKACMSEAEYKYQISLLSHAVDIVDDLEQDNASLYNNRGPIGAPVATKTQVITYYKTLEKLRDKVSVAKKDLVSVSCPEQQPVAASPPPKTPSQLLAPPIQVQHPILVGSGQPSPSPAPPTTFKVATAAGAGPLTPVATGTGSGPLAAPPKGQSKSPLSDNQVASLTVTPPGVGACPHGKSIVRQGRTTIEFTYDPDTKGDLEAQGQSAIKAANKQAQTDVSAQAAKPPLCYGTCVATGVSTNVYPSTFYGVVAYATGTSSARWSVSAACTAPPPPPIPVAVNTNKPATPTPTPGGTDTKPVSAQGARGLVMPVSPKTVTPVSATGPAAKTQPILSGSQEASLTVNPGAGTCACTNCTLRTGRTTIRFEYDQDAAGALDAAGQSAMTAANSQAQVDADAQAGKPGLCATGCSASGAKGAVTSPSTGYGGTSPGYGSASAGWTVSGACVAPIVSTPVAVSVSHPPLPTPTPVVTDTKPSTPPAKQLTVAPTAKPVLTMPAAKPTLETPTATKPSYLDPPPTSHGSGLTVPTTDPSGLKSPGSTKPVAKPTTCAAGDTRCAAAAKAAAAAAAAASQ